MQDALEDIAQRALYAAGEVVVGFSNYTVICKYDTGFGVGPHRDSDYNSSLQWIVSTTAKGSATFKVQGPDAGWYSMRVEEGEIVIFSRSIKHCAEGAEGVRVNITTRYGLEAARRMNTPLFKRTEEEQPRRPLVVTKRR